MSGSAGSTEIMLVFCLTPPNPTWQPNSTFNQGIGDKFVEFVWRNLAKV